MPYYSERSMKEIYTCDLRLQKVAFEVINYFDITITCGHRGEEAQNVAFHKGYSQLKFPESKHNKYPSLAMDCAPYPSLFSKKLPFYYMAGYLIGTANKMGIVLRWGGDFDRDNNFRNNRFIDLPHFEIFEGR